MRRKFVTTVDSPADAKNAIGKYNRHNGGEMQTARASIVDEGVRESDDDGVLFGGSCERRIFFPGSNEHTKAAGDVRGAQQRAPATDPLYALSLFPSSPYIALRENVPVPGNAAQEERTSNRARRSKSPKKQLAATDALGRGACAPLEQPWTTAAATSCRGKRFPSPTAMTRHDPSQVASYKEIYSPQKLQRCRGRFKPAADGNQERSTHSAAGESFDDDESAIVLLQKIRADEKATVEEAARLRCEADATVMIRRFWRRSG